MLSTRIVQKNARTNNLWGWGRNINYVISKDYGSGINISSPILTDKPPKFTQVSHGGGFACGIDVNGALWCWGRNNRGQLGNNSTTDSSSPVLVSAPVAGYINSWTHVSCGSEHVLAINYAGGNKYLYSWGRNIYGQLGLGNTTDYSVPIKVGGNSWIEISAGVYHSLGISYYVNNRGKCYGWGRNTYGQLGTNNTTYYSVPTQVADLSNQFYKVDTGWNHSLAIKFSGTRQYCYSWGRNINGQLGYNNIYDYSSPIKVFGTSVYVKSISAAGNSSAFINDVNNGELWVFGNNEFGQLGTSNTTYYSSPVRVVTSNVRQVSMISVKPSSKYLTSTFIKKSNDKTYGCGSNYDYYQLGDGTNIDRSSFVGVLNNTNWKYLSIGGQSTLYSFMLATKY